MSRRVTTLVCSLVTVVAVAASGGPVAAADCWRAPVPGRIVEPFREPPCPYCAGNRGIEYEVGPRTAVRAVAAGRVSWAGTIAGVRWVVVRHGDGRRITYGRLDSSGLRTGEPVAAGSRIGSASGDFYFGVRVGERYIDPSPFIGRLVGRPRLIPIDGTTPRAAPAPRLRCGR